MGCPASVQHGKKSCLLGHYPSGELVRMPIRVNTLAFCLICLSPPPPPLKFRCTVLYTTSAAHRTHPRVNIGRGGDANLYVSIKHLKLLKYYKNLHHNNVLVLPPLLKNKIKTCVGIKTKCSPPPLPPCNIGHSQIQLVPRIL